MWCGNGCSAARLMCFPSVEGTDGDCEGLGMVILEAMASGVPVVASKHGPIPEVIQHEQNGLLCAERDASGLAAGMERLLADRAAWERLSLTARADVCERFDLHRQTERLEAMYQGLVREHQVP